MCCNAVAAEDSSKIIVPAHSCSFSLFLLPEIKYQYAQAQKEQYKPDLGQSHLPVQGGSTDFQIIALVSDVLPSEF